MSARKYLEISSKLTGGGHGSGSVTQHFDVTGLGVPGDILVNESGLLVPSSNYLKKDILFLAGEAISAYQVVYASGSNIVKVGGSNISASFGKVIGFALQDAILWEIIPIRIGGFIKNPSGWGFVATSDEVYLDSSGLITKIPPSIGYRQRLGVIVDDDTVFINILEAIKRRS